MSDRGVEFRTRFSRVKRTAKWSAIAVGAIVAVMAANAGCNARASAESFSPGNLHGFGYDIDSSPFGPNIVRVTGRQTLLPWRDNQVSLSAALNRIAKDCGEFHLVDDALQRANVAAKNGTDNLSVVYGSIPNRLACLGQ
jgi:hypothetical protein